MFAPFNTAERVLGALPGLDLKVKGACGGGPSGEIDAGDLLEAQVHGRLVHIYEATLQRVEQARAGLIGAGDALSPRMTEQTVRQERYRAEIGS